MSLLHHVNAALRAHVLFEKNVDYIVTEEKAKWLSLMNILVVLCQVMSLV
ncbi:hypothetical protein O9993_19725 [Vibrio lentus]|nr:hypothetical protein [Vibrio lentus]